MTTDTLIVGPPLYKYDSKGKLRVWRMEQEGSKHRTVAGLDGGALTTSEWTQCVGKQKRSDEEQAAFEIASGYEYQLKREYFETPEAAAGEARFFKPMLAQKWSDLGWDGAQKRLKKSGWTPRFDGDTGVYAQPKLDGFCCIAQKTGLTSREGQPIVAVPHIMEALAGFFEEYPDAVLHGELYNHVFKDDFETLVSILKKQKNISEEQYALAREMAQFHLYDYAAPHVRDDRYPDRYEALVAQTAEHVELADGILHIVPLEPITSAEHLEQHRSKQVDLGYEGQMPKLDLCGYEQKRSWSVLKNKVFDDGEFEVVDIIEGKGNYSGYAKRVTCRLPDGRTFGAGIKGGQSKFNKDLLGEAGQEQKVVTITHFGWTGEGIPRMGVATKWHGAERTL
ncbi:hypothetical protein HOU03_gp464 [Caulobacter phage CcrSC]|uniref:DNA ligase n=1 Tax=Caulobacter phage CcrSC TaxID=2283272 RepID=A0A385EDF8_9CAUD|nr:hypothetical protein HOU03_gp464 [Caulobacter phage CcrSC]AXQ69803.1 hypothetical protein CcrSC_gp221 [Caulobacter phage CcrSC]